MPHLSSPTLPWSALLPDERCASNDSQDERWMGMIGERVVVEGLGHGSLEYFGKVRKSHNDTGKIMCGVMLDDRVVSNIH